jgi:1,4-alpha-glucan branching enzyme
MYRDRLAASASRFETRCARDLVAAFKRFGDVGILEIITSSATHAFLPCFDEAFARAQIRVGAAAYRQHFGDEVAGMWLPECGFVPGVDRLLAGEGIGYFGVDAHAIDYAEPLPVFGTYSPLVCPSGVAAFARDRESSAQVWSAEWGYPGDPRYREFYRDIGHELDGRNVGLKYHRVTGREIPLADKQPYDRGAALVAAAHHAEHFVAERAK